ncbi:YeeE/YedE family protein [Hydrogenophilus thermoluteolus]|uniref:YeeE/YedE family protein n=1 Tax=Hydrogenophilus thermoluteolus TaxID=297 RepID=UPI003F67B6A7
MRHVLGGLLFGVGMTLAGGCANKNVIRLGGGNLKSLLVLAIIAVTAYYLNWLGGYDTLFYPWLAATAISLDGPQELARVVTGSDSPLAHYVIGLLVAVAQLLFAFRDAAFRASRQHVFTGIVIGVVVTFLWWLTGSETTGSAWRDFADFADEQLSRVNTQSMTFIAPLGDLAYYLQAPSAWNRLNVGILVLVGVTLGSFLHALVTRSFRIEWFADRSDLLNHLVGAFLMGVGGILAMGCTFGQGITGISTLAVGSFLSLVSIVAGSALTMKWLYWRMMRDL